MKAYKMEYRNGRIEYGEIEGGVWYRVARAFE